MDGRGERRLGAAVFVVRRNPREHEYFAVEYDVRGPDLDPSEILNRADIGADEGVELIDRRRSARGGPETRGGHRSQRNFLRCPPERTSHHLQHDQRTASGLFRDNLRLTVVDLPAVREFHRESQTRMEKAAAADDALIRVVAVHDAVDALQEGIALDGKAVGAGLGLLDRRAHALDPIFRRRMRRKPVRHAFVVADLFDAS